MRAIVLAAGVGNRLRGVFDDPKCLIPIGGVHLLVRYLESFSAAGIREVVLVLGYGMKKVIKSLDKLPQEPRLHLLKNTRYREGSVISLWTAKEWLEGDLLIMDGDLCFEKDFLFKPVKSEKKDFFLIDSSAAYDEEAVIVGFKNNRAVSLARGLKGDFDVSGEWAGVLRLSPRGAALMKEIVCREVDQGKKHEGYEFIVPKLFQDIDITHELIDGTPWIEIDFPEDIERARAMFQKGVR